MKHILRTCFAAALFGLGASACSGAGDHGHDHQDGADHGPDAHATDAAKTHSEDHSKYGHLSAIYLCGDEELQTRHTDIESTLAYKGQKITVSRSVHVVDDAFVGESFKGKLKSQTLIFKGKGYDASLKIGDEVMGCEKLSCIPLGGPH